MRLSAFSFWLCWGVIYLFAFACFAVLVLGLKPEDLGGTTRTIVTLGFIFSGVTMGQLLSLPMLGLGLYLIARARPTATAESAP